LNGFLEPSRPCAARKPEGGVLAIIVAEPDAEDEAATRQDVNGRDVLGNLDRVEQGKEKDARGDTNPRSQAGKVEEIRQRLIEPKLIREEVLANGHKVESEVLREEDELLVLAKLLRRCRVDIMNHR
jgi:hypothetical protein